MVGMSLSNSFDITGSSITNGNARVVIPLDILVIDGMALVIDGQVLTIKNAFGEEDLV